MERNVLKRKWHILLNELSERWPNLTQLDIDFINGDKERLIERVQTRRHISLAAATADVEEFLNTRDLGQRIA